MADQETRGGPEKVEESPGKSAPSKLDNLSKEDLIKFVKKQTVVLQKTRAKCDVLTKKFIEKEAAQTKTQQAGDGPSIQDLQHTVDILEDEKKELQDAYNSVQQSQENAQKKIQELSDQVECMLMKDETVTASFQFMQEEHNKLTSENKELKEQTEVLSGARDEILHTLKSNKQHSGNEITQLQSSKADLESRVNRLSKELETITNLNQDLQKLIDTLSKEKSSEDSEIHSVLEAEKASVQDAFNRSQHQLEEAQEMVHKLKSEKNQLSKDFEVFRQSNENFRRDMEGVHSMLEEMQKERTVMQMQMSTVQEENGRLKDVLQLQQEDVHKLKQKLLDKEEEFATLENLMAISKSSVQELEQRYESSTTEIEELRSINENLVKELDLMKMNLESCQVKLNDFENTAVKVVDQLQTLPSESVEVQTDSSEVKNSNQAIQTDATCSIEPFRMVEENIGTQHDDLKADDVKDVFGLSSADKRNHILKKEKEDLKLELEHSSELRETLVFEVAELKEERDHLAEECSKVQGQLQEWESLMQMLKDENERLMGMLEESEHREQDCRKELECLVESLYDALTERDCLIQEVCEMKEHGGSLMDELSKMKLMVDGIIKENKNLQATVDKSFHEKGDGTIELEGAKRECRDAVEEKETMEREKESLSVIVQLAQEKEQHLCQENEEIHSKIQTLEEEKANVEEKFCKLKEDFESSDALRHKFEELVAEKEALTNSCQSYSAQLEGIKEQGNALAIILEDMKSTANDKDREVKEKSQYIKELETKVLELSNTVGELKTKYENAVSGNEKLEALVSAVGDLSSDKENLVSMYNEVTQRETLLNVEAERLNSVILEMEQNSRRQSEGNDSEMGLLQGEIESLKTKLGEKSEDKDDALSQLENLQSRQLSSEGLVTELRDSIEVLKNDMEEKKIELVAKDNNISNINAELENLNAELAKYRNALEASETENAVLQNNLHATKDMVNNNIAEIETLKLSVENITKKMLDKNEELLRITVFEQKFKDSSEQLRMSINENGELKVSIDEFCHEKAMLTDELQIQITKVERLKSNLDAYVSGADISHENIASLQSEMEQLKLEKDHENKTLQDAQNQMETVMKQSELLHGELQEKCKDIDSHQRSLLQTEQTLVRTRDEKEHLHNRLDQLQQRVVELERFTETLELERTSLFEKLQKLEEKDLNETRLKAESEGKLASEIKKAVELQDFNCRLKEEIDNFKLKLEMEVAENQMKSDTIGMLTNENGAIKHELEAKQAVAMETQQNIDSTEHAAHVALEGKLKEKDQLCNKLKALALRSKRELAEMKLTIGTHHTEHGKIVGEKDAIIQQLEQVQTSFSQLQTRCQQHIDNVNSLQAECDKLHDELDLEKKAATESRRDLTAAIHELGTMKETSAESKSDKERLNAAMEALTMQKQSIESNLNDARTKMTAIERDRDANRIQKEELLKDIQKVKKQLGDKDSQIQKLESEHTVALQRVQNEVAGLKQELSSAMQGAKQSSMMDLEIADYERTVQTLNAQLAERDRSLEERGVEILRLEERNKALLAQIEIIEEQLVQAEDRGSKLKQLLVKTKKDLADAKKWETEQRTSDAQLRGQQESLTQQAEEYKMQIAEVTSENQKTSQQLRSIVDANQRTVRSMEARAQGLQDDLDLARTEATTIQSEYDAYKVRVHNVLKQQKTKTPSDSGQEIEKEERDKLEKVIEQLKMKLREISNNLTALQHENEALMAEHERLIQRHTKLVQDSQFKDDAYRTKLEDFTLESSRSSSEHLDAVRQLTVQNEMINQSFKEQLLVSQEEHFKTVSTFHKQIDFLEAENYRLQKDAQQQTFKTLRHTEKEGSEITPEFVTDIRHEERQQGEGMEFIEADTTCPAGLQSPPVNPMSFEQLLSTSIDDVSSLKSQVSTDLDDSEVLKISLNTAQKRIDHMTMLMNESEATVLRLSEQAKVLKDEVRRLERNQAREQETSNMEYLKNILLKFLFLKSGDERERLVPVLTTMLKLSPEEKGQLTLVAKGDDAGESQASGWGSYLHRWSGMS